MTSQGNFNVANACRKRKNPTLLQTHLRFARAADRHIETTLSWRKTMRQPHAQPDTWNGSMS